MFITEVALGRIYQTVETMPHQLKAPEEFDSVRTVLKSDDSHSVFTDSEFCIYNPRQQVLRYLVEFSLAGDAQSVSPPREIASRSFWEIDTEEEKETSSSSARPEASLVATRKRFGRPEKTSLPLKAVHVRALVHDLVAKVTIFQRFTNEFSENCEAKYVFPLNENAAVCGFEAFINEKHIVGVHFIHVLFVL